jgi:hypothetical protein
MLLDVEVVGKARLMMIWKFDTVATKTTSAEIFPFPSKENIASHSLSHTNPQCLSNIYSSSGLDTLAMKLPTSPIP